MERERENGKGILFGVLGVMTLVIAILGASLAYFTATANSEPNAVTVQSATVSIVYDQGTNLSASDLIPSTLEIAQKAYNEELSHKVMVDGEEQTQTKQCVDANGRTVCSVFRFSVTNGADIPTSIEGIIQTTTDAAEEFSNLRYVVYSGDGFDETTGKLTNGTLIANTNTNGDEPGTLFAKAPGTSTLFPETTLTIGTGEEKTKYFDVLIWLNEEPDNLDTLDIDEGNQDDEQGLTYTGTVKVWVSGQSENITGSDGTTE